MLIGIAVIITCLFYGIMVYITYSTKRKLNNVENKIYKFLLKISIIGLLLELGCCFLVSHKDVSTLFHVYLYNRFRTKFVQPVMVHAYNPRPQEAEAGRHI